MSDTALDHRLVQDYLSELDAALRGLPAEQARELKEQISAHLEEALRPGADDQEVTAALSELGSPAEIAAEARAAGGGPGPTPAARPARTRPGRVRGFVWVAVGLAVILAVAGARYADKYRSAAPLQYWNNAGDWWYPQDANHENVARADNATQNTASIRSGQRQGYVIAIFNDTNVTQTVVGDASGVTGWNSPGSGTEQLTVSRSYVDVANGVVGESAARGIRFGLPVSIPPLQARLVRVLWTSDLCLQRGEANGIDVLYLWVRVGWFTKMEAIPQEDWLLLGPSHGRCTG
jgi:hypothetical protein